MNSTSRDLCGWCVFSATILVVTFGVLTPVSAYLFTEDADTNAQYELESETWGEILFVDPDTEAVLNQELNFGVTDHLDLGAFAAVAVAGDDAVAIDTPGAQLKIADAVSDQLAMGVMVGVVFNNGLAMPSGFALIPVTYEAGPVAIHAQLGWAGTTREEAGFSERAVMGIASEVALPADLSWLAEVVNADPADASGPPLKIQTGLNWQALDLDELSLEMELLGLAASDATAPDPPFESVEFGMQGGIRLNHQFGAETADVP